MARTLEDGSGGIRGLLALLDEHGEAVDADLQAHYGLTLADIGTPKLSLRRLRGLVSHLPMHSAYARAVLGDRARWTLEAHLLAVVIDALHAGNWQRGGGKGSRPKPMPRPGVDGPRRIGRTDRSPDEVRAYLDRFRPPQDTTEGG